MEDSLKDLLERLSDVATGVAHSHDKPANIVEEVRDVLDHLAEDELPAASAIFLAKVRGKTFLSFSFFSSRKRERFLKISLLAPRALPPPPRRLDIFRRPASDVFLRTSVTRPTIKRVQLTRVTPGAPRMNKLQP